MSGRPSPVKMMLAGQKPETIMEICSRALSFWTYQEHQERTYQEYVATRAKEKAVQLEQYYEQIISATKRELDVTKKKYNEISDKLLERNRQYQKLQTMYDTMRRKCITPLSFEGGNSGDASPSMRNIGKRSFTLPLSSGEEALRASAANTHRLHYNANVQRSPAEREFVLRPSSTPVIDVAAVNDIQSKFSFSIGTPK